MLNLRKSTSHILVLIAGLIVTLLTTSALAGENIYVPAQVEGITYTAAVTGLHRITVEDGAYSPWPEEGYLYEGHLYTEFKTDVLIYKNRPIEWVGTSWVDEHPNPGNPDYIILGKDQLYPTYEEAASDAKGLFVDIPLQAGEYLVFVVNNSKGYFGSGRGGVYVQVSTAAVAEPFWPLEVGKWYEYDKTDSAGNEWVVRFEVVGTETFGSTEYFHVRVLNNEPPKKTLEDGYFRTTDDGIYQYTGTGEYLFLQRAPVGTTWTYYNPNTGHNEIKEIISIGPLTVPYGTFPEVYGVSRFRDKNLDGVPDDHPDDVYIVPGVGLVKVVDFISETFHKAPFTMVLSRLGADYSLSVLRDGSGAGTVTSTPLPKISCGSVCSREYPADTVVTLTATARDGSTFTGWSGAGCAGVNSCVITMNGATIVKATFSASPINRVSPLSLNFGSIKKTGASTKPITIKNTGKGILSVGDIALSGTDADQFSETNDCNVPLAQGDACTVYAQFQPMLYGSKTAVLTVLSNDPKKPSITASLKGTCPLPKISVSPSSLNFGTVKTVGSATRKLTIKNNGRSDLTINSVVPSGSAFSITDDKCTGANLAQGASCYMEVTFAPTENGIVTGAIAITSNDPDPTRTTKTVTLKGMGS